MSEDIKMVPSAKVMLLGAAGLICMIAVGGALGYSQVAVVFQQQLDDQVARETGMTTPEAGQDGKVTLDIGIDMKKNFNSTHGIVYWYINVSVDVGSSMADVINSFDKAKIVELRIYDLKNSSQWVTVRDSNITNYIWDVDTVNFSGFVYISSIGGVAEDPGAMTQWLTYRWDDSTGYFEYVVQSTTKFLPSNGDKIVLLYSQLGVYPADCCTYGFDYVEYQGPS